MRAHIILVTLLTLCLFSGLFCFGTDLSAFSSLPFQISSYSPPTANFTYSPKSAAVNQTVYFYDHSNGTIISWDWDFNDGTTKSIINPAEANTTHAFNMSGSYNVRLTVHDDQENFSTAEAWVYVRMINTTLALTVPEPTTQGNEVTLTATLEDEYGNLVEAVPIGFYTVDGALIGSAFTDVTGRAFVRYTPQYSGVFQVKAVFNGTSVYAGSVSDVQTLEVGSAITSYVALFSVAILVMSAVLFYVRWRRRKGEKEEEEEASELEEEEEE